jgi:ATP-binding cassette, subfamily B, bacterial
MIESPGVWWRFHEDDVTRQQVRPGTARRVWPYLRRYRGPMVLLVLITSVDSAIAVTIPLILRLIIDNGILRHRESVIVTLALTVAGLALLAAAAQQVGARYSDWIGESLVLELRTSVFRHVLRQPLAFFTRTQTGSLVSRMEDVNETQRAVGGLMSEALSVLLNLVLVLAAMFWLSWQLSLVALAVIPLFVLPGKLAATRSQRLVRQEMQLSGELAAMMAERSDVSGALLAMLYGRPEDDAAVFTRKASRVRDLTVASRACMTLLVVFVTLLAALVTALVYGLGGTLVMHGVFQLGTLVAFIALVSQLYGPLNTMSSLPVEILTALVSFDRVFEILDLEPLITERPAAHPLSHTRHAPGVEVAGVWFHYPAADRVSLASLEPAAPEPAALAAPERPGDAWVLRDVTFQMPAGKLTALVGPSGAGKTTITHLVPRLYDPVRGAVRIGGHDVRDLTLDSLRSVVGVVPQDAHLFHDTIRANLLYARPSATEKELTEACQAARIWELISSLPDGLDTIAGDRGYRFSGGEKQRLALARLLLKAPSVVVLDEATAHLDSESELAIQRALATALAGRTSLVIAHRLSTVRAADQILVVDGGQIAERGTHDELLAAGGVYAGLYQTQFASQAALRCRTHWCDAGQDRLGQPPGNVGWGRRDRGPGRAEDHPRQNLAVDRADDQDHGGVDVGARRDAAQPLLAAQVGGEHVRQPPAVLLLIAVGRLRAERGVAADHGVEPDEDLRLGHQPGEGGRDPGQDLQAALDEPPQVVRHRARSRLRQQRRGAAHDLGHVGQQRVGQQVFLVLEVVVQHAVGDLRLPGDVADGQRTGAALADQPRGGGDQVLAQVLRVVAAEGSGFPR